MNTVTINGKTYTSSITESGHEKLTDAKGRVGAQCLFCEKVKGVAHVGECVNGFHAPFRFPIHICNACSKATGWSNGNEDQGRTELGGNGRYS